MKLLIVFFATSFFCCCRSVGNNAINNDELRVSPPLDSIHLVSYNELKENIAAKRRQFAGRMRDMDDSLQNEISDFWIRAISRDLYDQWQNTPWDFNGTSLQPQQGTIACGYFVTTLLKAMGLPIDRVKLSTYPSSQMMKSLTPHQPLKNLSYLDYNSFDNTLRLKGKSVYIIWLDYHTGFIVNDGNENWFIHSNYINRKGVTKEAVSQSQALKASKTRWLVSLTGDREFLLRWLKNK